MSQLLKQATHKIKGLWKNSTVLFACRVQREFLAPPALKIIQSVKIDILRKAFRLSRNHWQKADQLYEKIR
jgi:hypothetical protein